MRTGFKEGFIIEYEDNGNAYVHVDCDEGRYTWHFIKCKDRVVIARNHRTFGERWSMTVREAINSWFNMKLVAEVGNGSAL